MSVIITRLWHFRPCKSPVVLRQPLENGPTSENDEDDELIAKNKDYRYVPERMTWDPNCYECKVRYRDPKAKDLVMYLHAWRYKVSTAIDHFSVFLATKKQL